jgi:hypothetical protein
MKTNYGLFSTALHPWRPAAVLNGLGRWPDQLDRYAENNMSVASLKDAARNTVPAPTNVLSA